MVVILATHGIGTLCLLPVLWIPVREPAAALPGSFLFALTMTVLMTIVGRHLQFMALSRGDVAVVASFSALTPLLAIGSAAWILGESPTPLGGLGICVVAMGIYGFHFQPLRGVFSPLQAVFSDRTAQLAILAAIPPAFGLVFQKEAIHASDMFAYSFFFFLLLTLTAGCIVLVTDRGRVLSELSALPPGAILLSGALLACAQLCFSYAAARELVPYFGALNRISIVFQVLLAHLAMNQSDRILQRLLASSAILAGFLVIELAK